MRAIWHILGRFWLTRAAKYRRLADRAARRSEKFFQRRDGA